MIDSVLKGNGNSRFLKSAVPAGTSWADALAMLQAGTFPIDFNGINTEGFQQVGTPLNKANLLKDATAAQIGLPPSTTPDGMFQALGNTGELHVWRKTVTTAQEIPAGYTLGNTEENVLIASRETSYMAGALYYYYGNSITVSDNGNASNPASDSYEMIGRGYTTAKTILSGPVFVKCATDYISSSTGQQTAMPTKEGLSLFFIPSGGNLVVTVSDYPGNSSIKVVSVVATKYQLVNAYPLTPAGTTTTYPVSTNPNAYQDGDDAKEAGYVVGEVVSGTISVCPSTSSEGGWRYTSNQDSIVVSDAGEVSMSGNDTNMLYANSVSASPFDVLRGKYVKCPKINADLSDMIVYFPIDAVFSLEGDSPFRIIVNKYQPVTGYAAIPTGTTIEYLGKLGDKARVQVVSYVGTGTYGENNPCSISVDFPMKAIVFLARVYTNGEGNRISTDFVSSSYANDVSSVLVEQVPKTYSQFLGLGNNYYGKNFGKRSKDRKSYYWYNTVNENDQGNFAGTIYYFLVIG